MLHGKLRYSAKNISPGLLTDTWEMTILQGEAPKLPEILEIGSGSRREAAAGRSQQQDARIRKEKHGLVIRITHTCQVGFSPNCSVFPP